MVVRLGDAQTAAFAARARAWSGVPQRVNSTAFCVQICCRTQAGTILTSDFDPLALNCPGTNPQGPPVASIVLWRLLSPRSGWYSASVSLGGMEWGGSVVWKDGSWVPNNTLAPFGAVSRGGTHITHEAAAAHLAAAPGCAHESASCYNKCYRGSGGWVGQKSFPSCSKYVEPTGLSQTSQTKQSE